MKLLVTFCLLAFSLNKLKAQEFDFYREADDFLKLHVKTGRVDYAAIKADPTQLNRLVSHIESYSWTAEEEEAYLINVYNLMVLHKAVRNYPILSPLDVPGFFDDKDILINGDKVSLNYIENSLLRPKYQDPRVHFALVCGAIGCPPLIDQAYRPLTLNVQLDTQTERALNNDAFVYEKEGVIWLSEIFQWYRSDFAASDEQLIDYINKYRQTAPFDRDHKIAYYPYNWQLNDQQQPPAINGALPGGSQEINLQTFTSGSLLGKDKWDLTLFNSLYTETRNNWLGEDFTGYRATFVTHLIQVTYGVSRSKRFNVGLDLNLRNNGRSENSGFSGLAPAFSYSNTDSSRFGLTSIGPRIRWQPFRQVNALSIQSTVNMPVVRSPEGGAGLYWADWDRITWWNQIFYAKTWTGFQLFAEADLLFRFRKSSNQIGMLDLPVSVFLSYFPTGKTTVYAMTQHVQRYTNNIRPQDPVITDWVVPMNYTASGLGCKYNFTQNFNVELLYTNFWRGTNSGLGQTFNVGLKYVMF